MGMINEIKIPGTLLKNKKLQAQDRTIYGIVDWFNKNNGECVATNPVIAQIGGCSSRGVTNSICRLEKQGYIKREFKGNIQNGKRTIKILMQTDNGNGLILECTYCHLKDPQGAILTEDHDVPVSKGGTNELTNRVLCCRRCNSKKHDKTGAEFREEIGEQVSPVSDMQ